MRALAIIAAVFVACAVAAAQDDALTTARHLYSAAAYDEALAELARVRQSAESPTTTRDADAYRAFCLVALGRASEAQAIAESLVRADPMLSIDQFPDASPRIAAIFAAARRRVLPQLIKDEYRTVRAHALDSVPDAESRLLHVQQLLAAAEQIGAWDETLADVRMLVQGFLDLARAEPRSTAVAATSPAPSDAVASPVAAAISTAADAGVIPPTVVSQPRPVVPPALLDLVRRLHRSSAIDVVINEQGAVDDVIVRQSVNAAYDAVIVAAARTWKYRPATKDGVPIKFVKTVVLNASGE